MECGKRSRFTGAASLDDLGTFELNAGRTMVIRFQARPGNPRFDAAISPAITCRTGKLLGPHPWQGVVPPFAGNPVRTAVHAAIESNSPAATGAEYDRENDVLARTGSVGRFGNCQTIGVIRASYFARHRPAQVLVKRLPIQPRRIGVLHQTSLRGNGSGDSHAHSSAPSKFFLDSLHGFRNGAHCTFVVVPRSGHAMTMKFPAVALEGHEFNLRAAKIHPNPNELLF